MEPVYAGVIETLDDTVGLLLARLDALNLAANTIVIFTSDNGGLHVPEGPHKTITHNTPFRAGKGFLYEGGVRIPLIIRWPGHTQAGRLVQAPVINTDWVPTLLELCGQPIPGGLDGESFAKQLLGQKEFAARRFFWHFPHYNNQGGKPAGAVREGDWKLIEYYDDGRTELFNLASDAGEKTDLAAQQPDRVTRLREALAAWRSSVGAQTNTPNPNFDPAKYQEVYQAMDVSRYNAAQTEQALFEKVLAWRKAMNAVVPKARGQ